MATAGPKWPGPVTFNDDDPERGFGYVFLTIPNMTVNKPLLGKAEPKNAKIDPKFTKTSVHVRVTVNEKDGSTTEYEYKKDLPEDLDESGSSHKVKKGQVILKLCKLEQVSWGGHAKYFVKKDAGGS